MGFKGKRGKPTYRGPYVRHHVPRTMLFSATMNASVEDLAGLALACGPRLAKCGAFGGFSSFGLALEGKHLEGKQRPVHYFGRYPHLDGGVSALQGTCALFGSVFGEAHRKPPSQYLIP